MTKALVRMLARSADGASLVDDRGTIVYWNRAAERLLGFSAEEAKGRFCHELMRGCAPSGQPVCSPSCAIRARLSRGGPVRNFDMQTTTKQGRPVWLNISSLPLPIGRRRRFWAVHLFRDISRQAKVRQLVSELHAALGCTGRPEGAAPDPALPELRPGLPLSTREREVLRLLAAAKDTTAIAGALCISRATVRNHIQHILEKLGAHSRVQALAIAFAPRPGASRD